MLDYDIQAHILYVIIPNYTISIICDNNDLHICRYAKHYVIYTRIVYRVAKYGIIMLTVETYE